MTGRQLRWVVGLGAADVVVWALTLHAQADFHSADGAATSLGIVIGAIVSVALLVAFVLLLLAIGQEKRYRDPRRGNNNR